MRPTGDPGLGKERRGIELTGEEGYSYPWMPFRSRRIQGAVDAMSALQLREQGNQ